MFFFSMNPLKIDFLNKILENKMQQPEKTQIKKRLISGNFQKILKQNIILNLNFNVFDVQLPKNQGTRKGVLFHRL